MRCRTISLAAALSVLAGASPALGQTWAVEDPVLRQIWEVGMNDSRVMDIAQTLLASEHPGRVSREKRNMGQIPWPPCREGAARSGRAASGS